MYRLFAPLLLLLAGPAAAQAVDAPAAGSVAPADDADAAGASADESADDPPPGDDNTTADPVNDQPVLEVFPTPAILDALAPGYPAPALADGIEGSVVFVLQLDGNGVVQDSEVIRDPGGGLAEAATASIVETIFDAPPADGPPHELRRYFHVVRFVLPEEARPPKPEGPEPEMADELTALPELLEQVAANYPAAAREQLIQGQVLFELDVSDRGTLDAVRLLDARPRTWGFEFEAMKAVWQFRFKPAYAGEVPVPVRISYTYNFQLEQRVVEVAADTPDEGMEMDPDGAVNFGGFVRERGSRKPLSGVEVLIEEFAASAVSDDFGYFEFRGVPAGVHRILIAAPGYEKYETEEDVLPGEATEVVYFVRESPTGVNETVIRVKREKKEVTRRTISIETIERIPGTFGDPVKVVQNLPGVARSPFDFGLLIVRGSSPEDSGAHIDGVRVPQLFHFGGFRSILTPILLDSIDFYPGGYGGQYGRLTGGILDVKTRQKYEDTVHGLIQADLLDGSVALTGPIKAKKKRDPIGGFVIAARRSYLDIIVPALAPSSVDLSRFVFPRWFDVQGKVTLAPWDGHRFSLLAYVSQDRVGGRTEDPTDPNIAESQGDFQYRNDFWRSTLDWTMRAGIVRNTMIFSVGQDFTRLAAGQLGTLGGDAFTVYLRDTADFDLNDKLTLEAGLDFVATKYRFDLTFNAYDFSTQGDDPNAEKEPLTITSVGDLIIPGIWVEGQVKLVDERVNLTPGLRYDLATSPGSFATHGLDPRFRFRLTPDKARRIDIKGSAGLYNQPPQAFEIVDETGDPNLKNELSVQVTLGTELRFTDWLELEIEGFYKRLDRLVVFQGQGNGTDGAWGNTGDGHIYGGELFLRWLPYKNFTGWVSLTIQRSQRRDAIDEDFYWFDFDQPVILDVVASYELPYGFRVGARWRYVSGNPDTPIGRAIYDSDSDSYLPLNGTYNSARLPDFHQLDVRIDKDFNFRRWKLSVYLDLLNAYNRKNPESKIYNFDYTEQTFLYSLPILPNLGLKAQF